MTAPIARKSTTWRTEDTYERLRAAVVEVIFEHGYAGATTARIAQRAGLTRGAIQHYFGDRRVDMVAAVCEHIVQTRQEAYRSDLSRTVAGDFEHARQALKQAYRDPQTWLLIEVWIASKSDPELAERVDSILHRINDPIDAEIAQEFSRQAGAVGNFRTYKYLLRSLTRGLAIEYSRKPDAELFDSVVDLIFAALEAHLGDKRSVAEKGSR